MRTAAIAALSLTAAAFAEPPRVIRMVPDHGDTGVDPTLTEIRIEFDQDMAVDSQSICGGGPTFPKLTGRPRWDGPRAVIVPVALEPGKPYNLGVNCASFRNFKNVKGESAEITVLSFDTGMLGAPGLAPLDRDTNGRAINALHGAIDTNYSYRDLRVKNWDAAFNAAREAMLSATSRAQFARAAAAMLAGAADPHMSLSVGRARFATFRVDRPANVDPPLIPQVVPEWRSLNRVVSTGRFEDGIAYLSISAWPGDEASLTPAHEFLDGLNAKGLILDVRGNGGGDELAARRIAARFTSEPAVYSRNRTRDGSGGWTRVFDRTVEPSDTPRFAGRVAVLMGPACMSSNESFLLMMRHGAKATLVGEASYGSSGNPKPVDLGNGVTIVLPSWEDQEPDGTILEGRGAQPDVPASLGAEPFQDGILEAALAVLRRPN